MIKEKLEPYYHSPFFLDTSLSVFSELIKPLLRQDVADSHLHLRAIETPQDFNNNKTTRLQQEKTLLHADDTTDRISN